MSKRLLSLLAQPHARRRRTYALLVVIVLGLVFCWCFNWNWLRPSLERYVSSKTQRSFRIDDLNVRLGFEPVVTMQNVYFQNAPWSKGPPMARIGELRFSVSFAQLLKKRIVIPELAVTDGQIALERTADGRKNWLLAGPDDRSASPLRILNLAIHGGTVSYVDEAARFTVSASDMARNGPGVLQSQDPRFQSRIDFRGSYREAPFSGEVLTASVLGFQETDRAFPLMGHLDAGRTKLDVNGSVKNLVELSAIDADLKIQGATLANLYPFLRLPLPASPPYAIAGHIVLSGSTYRFEAFHGTIGTTDIAGDASYESREPRPLLKLTLHSKDMDVDDLGPLLGVETASGSGRPSVRAALGSRREAMASEHAANSERGLADNNDRLLPIGALDAKRMDVLDADVSFRADRLHSALPLPFDRLAFRLDLRDAILHIDPLDLGFAGGQVTGQIVLNAQSAPIEARNELVARGIHLGELLPKTADLSPSEGRIGGQIHLEGKGDSIAQVLAHASGYVRAAISGGRISNLADAAIGLNGGKILHLLVVGDKTIAVRCGIVDFEFTDGKGESKALTLDTEQTEVLGQGTVNLGDERFDIALHAQPKDPGIFSLRSPIRVFGTFKHADYAIDKSILAAHLGGAIALGILNPVAGLIPLLETGPGSDANCRSLLPHGTDKIP